MKVISAQLQAVKSLREPSEIVAIPLSIFPVGRSEPTIVLVGREEETMPFHNALDFLRKAYQEKKFYEAKLKHEKDLKDGKGKVVFRLWIKTRAGIMGLSTGFFGNWPTLLDLFKAIEKNELPTPDDLFFDSVSRLGSVEKRGWTKARAQYIIVFRDERELKERLIPFIFEEFLGIEADVEKELEEAEHYLREVWGDRGVDSLRRVLSDEEASELWRTYVVLQYARSIGKMTQEGVLGKGIEMEVEAIKGILGKCVGLRFDAFEEGNIEELTRKFAAFWKIDDGLLPTKLFYAAFL